MRVSAKFSQLVSGKSWIFKQRAATSLETSPESTTSFNSAIKVTFEFTCGFNQNGKKIEKAWNFPLRYVCRATKIWKAKVRNRLLERLVNFSRTWKYIPPHSTYKFLLLFPTRNFQNQLFFKQCARVDKVKWKSQIHLQTKVLNLFEL